MMQKSVLVLGSTCVDVIIRLERLPKTEENLRPLGQRFAMGGCAYNVANVLGRAGADVTFVTPVGLRGVYGPYVLPILNKQPWVKPVLLPEAENGCCYCLVEASGERTFLSVHGTEYSFMSDWMAPYRNRRFDYGYVCGLELEEPTGGTLVTWLEKEAVDTVLYAPGPRGLRVPAERTERLLSLHPMLHLNEAEARMLSGCDGLETAARTLAGRTGNSVVVTLGPDGAGRTGNSVVVTLGADGALALDAQGQLSHIPGCPVSHVADTIGAGDAHAGALLLGLSRGLSLKDACALANRVAAQAVMQTGATLSDEALRQALA